MTARAGAEVRTTSLPGISTSCASGACAGGAGGDGTGLLVPPVRIRRQAAGKCRRTQLVQRTRVDPALEVDHFADRLPVIHPPPAVEFRLAGQVEAKLRLGMPQAQQVPALLLPDHKPPGIAPHEACGQAVAQPPACLGHDPDILARQTDLLVEFAEQRFLGGFAPPYAALGKLPALATGAATDEQPAIVMHQHDADIGPKAVL